MTLATKITVARICLVPVFAAYAIAYGLGVAEGNGVESYRWAALALFIVAAASDGIDGWVARRFNQRSELGAFLDPIADKFLVLTAILILTFVDWGADGWSIPVWFTAIVILRDCVILGGIRILYSVKRKVTILPHSDRESLHLQSLHRPGLGHAENHSSLPHLPVRFRGGIHPLVHAQIPPARTAHT